jgi:drug/metabolite transporter (DMT)-like permease
MSGNRIHPVDVLLMLCLIIFWGSSFVVVKILLLEGLSPVAIATFRFLVAGALFILALIFLKIKKRKNLLLFEGKDTLMYIFLSLVGVTFFFTIQYMGIELAGASVAAILVCFLSPMLIALFSVPLFGETLGRKQIVGLAMAGIGTLVVIAGGTMDLRSNSGTFFIGSLILLLTPVLWAAYTLAGKKVMKKYNPFFVVAYVNILGGLFLIPFSVAENSLHSILTLSLQAWAAILYLAVTCSFVGYFIWFYVMNRLSAAITSSFLFAEPLVTVSFAIAFVGENITLNILIGGLLIFVGVFAVSRK